VHGAQDSSSFILLHEHAKVFKIIYIQIVRETSVRETSCTGNNRRIRPRRRPGNVFPGNVVSGKVIVREMSVTRVTRESTCLRHCSRSPLSAYSELRPYYSSPDRLKRTLYLTKYCTALIATIFHSHCVSNARITITSGYATWFTAGGSIRIAHYDVIDDVITRKL